MKLSNPIRRALLRHCQRTMQRREPDFIIGDNYLRRWWIIPRNRWLNIYLHEFHRSDDDRALHDHPWASCSIILRGCYWEHLPRCPSAPARGSYRINRPAGSITWRRPSAAHRIELPPNAHLNNDAPVITLFLTGPRIREWGFWCVHGFRHWRDFTSPTNSGEIGRGCGED